LSETEERVVEILTSQPRSDNPWTVPLRAVSKLMKWDVDKTRLYVEYLVNRKSVVLNTVGLNKTVEPEKKGEFWWQRGEIDQNER
jgi:hypothetical protein